jgi:phosphatidyl-myo-inositol alpha-mannosyltransferase
LMAVALTLRALCWRTIARAAFPRRALRFSDFASATAIGALVSAILPGRAGEPTRALVVSRRVGRASVSFPTLLGTVVVQSVINAAALIMLGVMVALTSRLLKSHPYVLPALLALPALAIGLLELEPRLASKGAQRMTSVTRGIVRFLVRVRKGLAALRQPRLIAAAAIPQLAAWAAQAFACYAVSRALSLQGSIGLGPAAAVLFGVNVAAAVPLTPSNVGVFQLAVLIVLSTGYGVRATDAVGYGLVLQAVEFVTAVALGAPSLLREGLTWRGLRVEAFSAVQLAPGPRAPSIS